MQSAFEFDKVALAETVYVPTWLAAVAEVEKDTVPPRSAAESLPRKPAYDTVNAGLLCPYVFDASLTVTVTAALVTVNVPPTYVRV